MKLRLSALVHPPEATPAYITLDLPDDTFSAFERHNAHYSRRTTSLRSRGWCVNREEWPNQYAAQLTFADRPGSSSLTDGTIELSDEGITWTFRRGQGRLVQSQTWTPRNAGLAPVKRSPRSQPLPQEGRRWDLIVDCDDDHHMRLPLTRGRVRAILALEREVTERFPSWIALQDRLSPTPFTPAGTPLNPLTTEIHLQPTGLEWVFCTRNLIHIWSRTISFDEFRGMLASAGR